MIQETVVIPVVVGQIVAVAAAAVVMGMYLIICVYTYMLWVEKQMYQKLYKIYDISNARASTMIKKRVKRDWNKNN